MPSTPEPFPATRHERQRMIVDGIVGEHRNLFLTDPTYHAWVNAMAQLLLETSDGFAKALSLASPRPLPPIAPPPDHPRYTQMSFQFPDEPKKNKNDG